MSIFNKSFNIFGISIKAWVLYLSITIWIALITFSVVFFTVIYPTMKSTRDQIQGLIENSQQPALTKKLVLSSLNIGELQ